MTNLGSHRCICFCLYLCNSDLWIILFKPSLPKIVKTRDPKCQEMSYLFWILKMETASLFCLYSNCKICEIQIKIFQVYNIVTCDLLFSFLHGNFTYQISICATIWCLSNHYEYKHKYEVVFNKLTLSSWFVMWAREVCSYSDFNNSTELKTIIYLRYFNVSIKIIVNAHQTVTSVLLSTVQEFTFENITLNKWTTISYQQFLTIGFNDHILQILHI